MAKKITAKRLTEIKERILHDGSCLEKESSELGMTKEDLVSQLEKFYEGGRKNSQFKQVLANSERIFSRFPKEEQDMYRIPAKNSSTAIVTAKSPASKKVSKKVLSPVTTVVEPSISDMIDELLKKKEALEKELTSKKDSIAEYTEIVKIHQESVLEATQLFSKAQEALKNAKIELETAENVLKQKEDELNCAETSVLKLDEQIQELKDSMIYLVGPWYNGSLPEYGTFISTETMPGVNVQEVSEEYIPEATLEGVLLFDYVPDFKRARIFCGLVRKFKTEGRKFTLLVSSESLKELLEMYV